MLLEILIASICLAVFAFCFAYNFAAAVLYLAGFGEKDAVRCLITGSRGSYTSGKIDELLVRAFRSEADRRVMGNALKDIICECEYFATTVLILAVFWVLAVVISTCVPGIAILFFRIMKWHVTLVLSMVGAVFGFPKACYMSWRDYRAMKVIYKAQDVESYGGIRRTTSALKTDEHGAYLDAGDNHRVYLNASSLAQDVQLLRMFPMAKREEAVGTTKEALIARSKMYKIDRLPDFQGQFVVDGVLIGHFSRIKFRGRDCLLTAYHVLDYNRSSLVCLAKGDKMVRLDSLRTGIVAASHTDDMDFLILEVPTMAFATLGIKTGTFNDRVKASEPISICQLFEGKPCVSSASLKRNEDKAWHVDYAASTTTGTSGAPILDARNRIVGVHLEFDSTISRNVGVIPPVFRLSNPKKESMTNQGLADGEEDPEQETAEQAAQRFARRFEQPEDADNVYFGTGAEREDLQAEIDYYEGEFRIFVESDRSARKRGNWGEEMEEYEDALRSKVREAVGYDIYLVKENREREKRGKHINTRIKGKRLRKESPWSCGVCGCVHLETKPKCVLCGTESRWRTTEETLEEMERLHPAVADVLNSQLPVEMVEEIMQKVIHGNLIKKMSMDIAKSVEERVDKKLSFWEDQNLKLELAKNSEIAIDKDLYEKFLKWNSVVNKTEDAGQIRIDAEKKVLGQTRQVLNEELSRETGGVALEQVTEPTVAFKVVESKSARKRRNKNNKKKAAVSKETVVAPSASLNSKAPAPSGASTTNGTRKSETFQRKPLVLGGPKLSSPEEVLRKSPIIGKSSAALNQNIKSSVGPKEELTPRKSLLPSK